MAMFVGVCTLRLRLYGIDNLKAKRGVVRRVINRTQQRFKIAMNEVADLEDFDQSTIGLAVVGNDQGVLNSLLDRVIAFVEDLNLADVVAADFTIEAYG